MPNASLLISTCDNYSDLWDAHISLLKKNWKGEMWKVFLVTDKETSKEYEGINIIVAGEDKDFPMRIKYAAEVIKTDYILLTLDDYFVINEIDSQKLDYLVQRAESETIDYLKLYDRRKTNPSKYESIEKLNGIDLSKKYAITLYPAIWERSFLFNSVTTDMSPWTYEPSLTKYATESNANCMFSYAGAFDILDVVRKGRILRNADKFFKKNGILIGDRPLMQRRTEFKLALMDRISWYTPRMLFVLGKRVLTRFGKKFYSED